MTAGNDVNAETSVFEAAPGPQHDEEFPSWVVSAQEEGNTTLHQLLSHKDLAPGDQEQETLGDVLGLPSGIQTEDNLETLLSGTFLFTAESLAHLRSAQPGAAAAHVPADAAPVAPAGNNGAAPAPTPTAPAPTPNAAAPTPNAAAPTPSNKRPAESAIPQPKPPKAAKAEPSSTPGIAVEPMPTFDGASMEEKLALLQKRDGVQQQELKLLRAALKHLYKKYQTMKSKYNEMKGVLRSHQAAQQQALAVAAAQQSAQQAQQQQQQAATFPTPFNTAPAVAQMQPMGGQGMQAYMQSPYSPHGMATSAGTSAMPNSYVNASTPSGGIAYQQHASPGSFTGGMRPQFASTVQQQLAAYGHSGGQPAYQPQQQQTPQGQNAPLYATNANVPTITFAGGAGFPSSQQQQRR